MLESGKVLQDRYRVVRRLNQGGMATVYLALDTRLGGRQVAVKQMHPQALGEENSRWAGEAFRQEANLLARLDHPGLAAVIDFFEEGGFLFLVMEYVPGETLSGRLAHSGPFAEEQVRRWAKELTSVLAYLHRHEPPIVFRDLKPDNIIVQPDGTLKLIDFGIARFVKRGQHSDTVNLGTPGYAAPEQYGHGQTDPRADVYSLGVLLYQLLTGYDPGRTPFNLPPLHQQAPSVSPRLTAVIEQAVAFDPAQRFIDAAAMRQSLQNPANPIINSHAAPWYKHYALLLIIIGVVLFVVAVSWRFWPRQAEAQPVPPKQTTEVIVVVGETTEAAISPTSTITLASPSPTAQSSPTPTTFASSTPAPATATTTTIPPTEQSVTLSREDTYLENLDRYRTSPPVVYAYAVDSAPTIDGDLKDWDATGYPVRAIVYGDEFWSGDSDLSGLVYAAWDMNNLYLALDITDDYFVQESSGRLLYRGDSAELWLDADLAGDFANDGMNDDDTHIGASPGHPDSLFTQSYRWAPLSREGVINDHLAAAKTRKGYTLEWAIPWSQFGITPHDGAAYGFTVCLSDNDREGAQEQESMVCLHGTRRYNSPATWGTLILATP